MTTWFHSSKRNGPCIRVSGTSQPKIQLGQAAFFSEQAEVQVAAVSRLILKTKSPR